MKKDLSKMRIAVVPATLFVAMHPGEDPDAIHDAANMMLIPLQIKEGGDTLVDYSFAPGAPYMTGKTVGDYDYANGLPDSDLVPPAPAPAREHVAGSVAQPLSAEELDALYNPDGNGQHPVYTRKEWQRAVSMETTVSGYWQWLADLLEEKGMPDDKLKALIVETVATRLRYWSAIRSLERAFDPDLTDDQAAKLSNLIDAISDGIDDPDSAGAVVDEVDITAIKEVFA